MRKVITSILVIIAGFIPTSAVLAYSRTPSGSTPVAPIVVGDSYHGSFNDPTYWWGMILEDSDGNHYFDNTQFVHENVSSMTETIDVPIGTHIVNAYNCEIGSSNQGLVNFGNCNGGSLQTYSDDFTVSAPPPTQISDFITLAKTDFNNQLGFSLDSVLTWMSGVLLFFIGSGFALLDAMKVWIVAVIAIGVVIFFVFKGLRFFGASK